MTHFIVQKLIPRLIMLLLVLTHAPAAHAAQLVTDCDFTCTADCELAGDFNCPVGVGVYLAGGADLDLKGHHLICDNPSDPDGICTGPAVIMSAASSVIRDTGAGQAKGGIVGPFAKAIDCAGYGGSRVTGIAIDDIDGDAVLNCATIDNNVIVSRNQLDYIGNPAITTGITSSIRNNYIGNFVLGIKSTGNKATTIDANVIENQAPLGGAGFGGVAPLAINVVNNTSNSASVTNNSIIGPGGGILGRVGITFSNNRCNETSADCQTCISQGFCTAPAVPYCLDRALTLRPVGLGDKNQFDLLTPGPGISSYLRWVLVNDFPDGEGEVTFHSAISNQLAGSAKTELFHVGNGDAVPADTEFQSCVIEAHIAANGFAPIPTYLVVKTHGVQSDGPAIAVSGNYPLLYTRVMTVSPAGTQWKSADLDGTLQIGVKNGAGPLGVAFGDIVMRCQ